MSDLNQDSIPIMNYLKIFFRRKEIIIICTFLGLVAGVCISILLPKQYLSSSVILVEEGKSDNPLFDKLAVSTTVQQRLDTIRESMLGYPSLVKLVKRLNLDREVKNTKEFEELIIQIRKNIKIRLRGHNILYLSYIGENPVETQGVVENITDIFIDRNKSIQDQETKDAISFIEEQLKVYKGKIKSAEIAKFQDELDELLVDSTEKHPLVKSLKEKIDIKRKELAKENLEYTEAETIGVESNMPLIDSIKGALDSIEKRPAAVQVQQAAVPGAPLLPSASDPEVVKVMLLEKLDNVLARDAKVNENIYNLLLQRLETAKITKRLQLSKEGTRYTIIEPPRVPLEPFKPNRILVILTGLIFGGIIGFGLVFANEFLDKSFIDVEEAKEYLGVPLLGAISKINTEDTIKEEQDKKRWMYSLSFVVGIVLIVVTMTITNIFK